MVVIVYPVHFNALIERISIPRPWGPCLIGLNARCRHVKSLSRIVHIYSLQGLRSSVLKHSRLLYGLSDPGVPKLVVYRKPVVMFLGSGGLALTGWSARLITSIKSP